MNNVTTNIFKGENRGSIKGWQAESRLKLSDGRELEITTHKGLCSGTLDSSATVFHIDGNSRIHSFAFGARGDFRKTLFASKERCTEKSVRLQHTQAVAQIEDLLAEIEAHYSARQQQAA